MSGARTQWSWVLLAVAAGIVAAFNLGKVPVLLPVLRPELHLDALQAGWIASAISVLAACTGIPFALALGRRSGKGLVLFGLSAVIIGSGLGGLAHDAFALMLARVVEGLGLLAVAVGAPILVSIFSASQDRTLAFSLWSCYVPAGAAAGILVTQPLARHGWHAAWLASGALAAILLLLFVGKNDTRSPAGQTQRTPTDGTGGNWRILMSPIILRLNAAFLVYTLMMWALLVWLPTLLLEFFHVRAAMVAPLAAAVTFANVAGNIGGGLALRRGVSRRLLMAAALVSMGVLGMALFWIRGGAALQMTELLLFSALGGMLPASVLSAFAEITTKPGELALLQGSVLQASNLGQLLGPVATAWLGGAGDWRATGWIFCGGVVFALLFICLGKMECGAMET